jgi:hypothetical protein
MVKRTITPGKLKTRDHLMVKVITGATKAGVHKDRRKEANKRACRKGSQDTE